MGLHSMYRVCVLRIASQTDSNEQHACAEIASQKCNVRYPCNVLLRTVGTWHMQLRILEAVRRSLRNVLRVSPVQSEYKNCCTCDTGDGMTERI